MSGARVPSAATPAASSVAALEAMRSALEAAGHELVGAVEYVAALAPERLGDAERAELRRLARRVRVAARRALAALATAQKTRAPFGGLRAATGRKVPASKAKPASSTPGSPYAVDALLAQIPRLHGGL